MARDGDPVDVWRHLWHGLSLTLGCDRIDVVILNRPPLLLRCVVQRDGLRAWETDLAARKRFEIHTRGAYWKFEPRLRACDRALLDRVARGTFGT